MTEKPTKNKVLMIVKDVINIVGVVGIGLALIVKLYGLPEKVEIVGTALAKVESEFDDYQKATDLNIQKLQIDFEHMKATVNDIKGDTGKILDKLNNI